MKPFNELSDDEKTERLKELDDIFKNARRTTSTNAPEHSPIDKMSAEERERQTRPTFAVMLNSIIDWKLEGLRKELTTPGAIPWPKLKMATAWLASTCPMLYEYAPRLEAAKLIERTSEGFNVKCQQATFACLLGKCGFQDWKNLGKYVQINGVQPKGKSVKNQASPGKYPKEWHKIKAAIPEI